MADRFVSSEDAKEGDVIVMTKTAGIEGTSILASMATKESKFKNKLELPLRLDASEVNNLKSISRVARALVNAVLNPMFSS